MTRFKENAHEQSDTHRAKPWDILALLYNEFSRPYLKSLLAKEISTFSRYFDCIYQVSRNLDLDAFLLQSLRASDKQRFDSISELPNVSQVADKYHLILFNGNLNHHYDVEEYLRETKKKLNRRSRICAIVYNPYLRSIYSLANFLGIRKGALPTTYLTQSNLKNICALSGYEIVRSRPVAYIPWSLLGLGTFVNNILQATPFLRWLGFAEVLLLRPIITSEKKPSLSIVIPARNEKGNIEGAVTRLSSMKFSFDYEIIFVEGHSQDGTWLEIQRVQEKYQTSCQIQSLQQIGKGKSDAVRLGFQHARKELLTILDADLTMPPELLQRFYEMYLVGKADFINGNRLVYPMEGEAMRFLNWLGNLFFAKALSWVLETEMGDTLCGTKLLSAKDYKRFTDWRKDFGDFDPFGDFELLFPASILGLGIVDIPIRYRARTYGATNINRFRHGLMLLKMTLVGFFRVRVGF